MNGEIPSVPITTLAGVSSLVDLLPEMPLPSPLPQTLSNKSLLFHPRVAEEAQRLLQVNDDSLIPQLVQCLSQTSSRHIELKDPYNEPTLDLHAAPNLLSGILMRKHDVFNGNLEHQVMDWSHQLTHTDMNSQQSQQTPPQMYSAMNHVSGLQPQLHSHLQTQPQHPHSPRQQQAPILSHVSSPTHHTSLMNNDTSGHVNNLHSKLLFNQQQSGSIPPHLNSVPNALNFNIHAHHLAQPDNNLGTQQNQAHQHNLQHQQHQVPQPAHSHGNQQSLNKHNVVDWSQVHSDLHQSHQPQMYGVNNMPGSLGHHAQPQLSSPSRHPTPPSASIPQVSVPSGLPPAHASQQPVVQNEVHSKPAPVLDFVKTETPAPPVNFKPPAFIPPPPVEAPVQPNVTPVVNSVPKNLNMKLQIPRMDPKLLVNKIPVTPQQQTPPKVQPTAPARVVPEHVEPRERFSRRRSSTSLNPPEPVPVPVPTPAPAPAVLPPIPEPKDKKRRGSVPVNPPPEEVEELPKTKIRRVERMLVPMLEKLSSTVISGRGSSGGSGLEGTTYHRFLKTMGVVLENNDADCDRGEVDLDDDGNVAPELLIPKHQLNELCAEAAKLKALGAMEAIPSDKIVELLKLLEMNIREGCKVTPLADPDDNEDESRLWLELTMESIQRGVAASLTALHILTSQNMPKRAYIEDLIDRIVHFTKFQLQNTIFPTFDPVYRVDPKGKDGFGSGKRKRAHAREVREKNMISFYNKIHEVVSLLAELLNVQILTDTTVLHLSTLGVSPFFVENVSELQLSALKLVTCIFTQYEKHRRLLLDDILASIARLPSSKRSLRTFKLSAGSDDCIQMLTALVLQLIQCVAHLPEKLGTKARIHKTDPELDSSVAKQTNADRDSILATKFDTAVRTAGNFLTVFLNKCGSKSEDCDYKLLFENFLQDLLSTVNKPEWPASELLLSLLGTLLVKNLGNKQLEVSMRVASLEYLGVAAARLRKDAVSAHVRMDTIDRLIADIKAEEEPYSNPSKDETVPGSAESEEQKTEFLQRILLDYLAVHGQDDPSLLHSRHFYIAAWWKSAESDITKAIKGSSVVPTPKKKAKPKRKKRKGESSEDESDEDSDIEELDDNKEPDEIHTQVLQMTEQRKAFLLTKVRPFSDPITSRKTEVLQSYVDYHSAELITRYLASRRPFSASFDFFLTRILSVSSEQTVAIRTKSLKCLTMVVEADANVLARQDMQMWVQHSFLDQSTAVREAAVDLVGKYVLSCPDLIDKYYEMLSLRILDTGVSVRKRVIKILRDICVECPQFDKIPEICVKMIRRVNDEDGIRKLVMEVFQNMWFTPVRVEPLDQAALLRKVSNITDVVASCEKVGLDFFEQLLLSLFKPKDDREDLREKLVNQEPPKVVVTASTQIVNCLVEHVLRSEEGTSSTGQPQSSSSQRFIACVATLFLFAKIRPQLLINHAITLQAYLSLKCQNQSEISAIANIGNILELVVPLLVNPSESFLSQLEEDCVKLLFKNEKSVIDSCLACLGAVVNKSTKNYKLVRDVFRRFQNILANQTRTMKVNPNDPRLNENRPVLRRAVYTIGLFLRHFDFTRPEVYGEFPADIVSNVFHDLLYLLETPGQDLQYFSLQAIGNLCIRHYDYMLGTKLKTLYQLLLTASSELKLKVQALSNIQLYLVEEELRMIKQDQEWNKTSKSHDIKEMGDVTSGMASTIVQIYLKQILEAFLHSDLLVRLAAVRVIQLVLQQGLVHPIQIVPYLICMSTDEEQGVGTTADKQLQEMEKKHPQFLQSQVLNGIRLSLQLQRILKGYTGSILPGGFQNSQSDPGKRSHLDVDPDLPIVRGYRTRPKEAPSALNGFLYSLLRSTKPQRRAIALSLLKLFDEQNKTRLADLLYYADNLAYFPYQVVDEPLFIIHHVDIVISVTGSNLLQAFKESLVPLHPPPPAASVKLEPQDHGSILNPIDGMMMPMDDGQVTVSMDEVIEVPKVTDIMEDDEDEDVDSLLKRVPENTKPLEEFTIGSQGCLLLLMLKQHLKDYYGLTEARISSYSPSDATKTFERPVNRKNTPIFDPKCTIANLQVPPSGSTPESRRALVEQYIHFKQLMLRIDPEEGEEDGEVKQVKIKIDQSLFTYPNARAPAPPSRGRPSVDAPSTSENSHHHNSRSSTSNSGGGAPYYAVMSQAVPPPGTPVAKVEPMVRVPKLTIVPLKFPGNAVDKKTHKVKEHHHHHHKHKKSKHKKKKRYAVVSDDEDSDNPDSDPDFRL